MGKLFIPGEIEIQGPWFLGTKELEELDLIIEFIENAMTTSYEKDMEELATIDFQKKYYVTIEEALLKAKKFNSISKKISLVSKDEKRLIDSSIKNILKDPKTKDLVPKELDIDINMGQNNRFSLTIEKGFTDRAKLKMICFDPDIHDEIKYKIESWLEANRPNRIKQVWNKYFFLFSFISFFCFFYFYSLYLSDREN